MCEPSYFCSVLTYRTAVSPVPDPDDVPDSVGAGDVAIRQAERADLLEVFRIERVTFPQPWPFSAFESFLGERGFLVAEAGSTGAVVGYVVSDTTPNYGRDIGHVKDLAIHPDARRRGLGRTLLGRALDALGAEGAALVKLEVRASNDAAVALYRSEGFEPLRRIPRYYENGEDAYVMALDLTERPRTVVVTDPDADATAEPPDLVTDEEGG
jgi:ribosomal-protein-alanine N-acetyltransferase